MATKNWNPEKIQEELKKAGITQAGIARDLGLKDCSVSLVVKGYASDRVRKHIALCIGRSVEEIWPDAYPNSENPVTVGRKRTHGLYDNVAA